MSFLLRNELVTYYPKATALTEDDQNRFLAQANAYAFGFIGGIPQLSTSLPPDSLKAAVALAFEILATGEEAAINTTNGNITEAAPTGYYVRKADNPFAVVDRMLAPYAEAFKAANAAKSDNSMVFM